MGIKITELTESTAFSTSDYFVIDDAVTTRKIKAIDAINNVIVSLIEGEY